MQTTETNLTEMLNSSLVEGIKHYTLVREREFNNETGSLTAYDEAGRKITEFEKELYRRLGSSSFKGRRYTK